MSKYAEVLKAAEEMGIEIPKPTGPLEKALLFLADRCDGASSIDGQGFNKNDSLFGKVMADKVRSGQRLTHDEYKSVHKMVGKYNKQLVEGQMDIRLIPKEPSQDEPEQNRGPETEEIPEDIQIEAVNIMETGDPLSYMLDTFNESHVGDTGQAKSQFLSFGSQSALNSKGINDAWEGPSGAGKSDAAKACTRQLPSEYIFIRTVTAKSLYMHGGELLPGSVIYSDDSPIEAGSDLESTMKQAQTFFQEGAEHETLDAQRNLLVVKLPPRLMFLRTNVDSRDADGQLANRNMGLTVDSSPEVDAKVCDKVLTLAEDGKTSDTVTRSTLICRAMWRDIKGQAYRVKMPAIKTLVEVRAKKNRRNPSVFVDMVAGLACIRHRQRGKDSESGEMVLYAAYQDYVDAAEVFNRHAAYLSSRLDPAERAVIRYLGSLKNGSATIGDIHYYLKTQFPNDGWSDTATRRLIVGRKERGTTGLLGKCGDIEPIDGYSSQGRPTRHYKWNGTESALELYDIGDGVKVWTPEEKGLNRDLPTFSHLFPGMGKPQTDMGKDDDDDLPNIPKTTEDGKKEGAPSEGVEEKIPENHSMPGSGKMGKSGENNTVNVPSDSGFEGFPGVGKPGKTWEDDGKPPGQIEAELQQAEERAREKEAHDKEQAAKHAKKPKEDPDSQTTVQFKIDYKTDIDGKTRQFHEGDIIEVSLYRAKKWQERNVAVIVEASA